jgi:hypothetical protein
VRALQESEEAERRAAARLAECLRLRQMLGEAQAVLQRLSRWAATQSTRLAPSTSGPRPAAADAPSTSAGKADTATPGAPLEESWS